MMTKIDDLAYEIDGDRINLEQSAGCGEVVLMQLHPIHVRLLAGELGLLGKGSADAWRTVETLCRRIGVLQHRIEYMAHYLENISDSVHADLSHEQGYARATADIADEFSAEIPDYVRAAADTLRTGDGQAPTRVDGAASSGQMPLGGL